MLEHTIKLIRTGEIIGRVHTDRRMTDEEICDLAGIEIRKKAEDYENDDMYDMCDLWIS